MLIIYKHIRHLRVALMDMQHRLGLVILHITIKGQKPLVFNKHHSNLLIFKYFIFFLVILIGFPFLLIIFQNKKQS